MLRCLWVALLTISQVWGLRAQNRPNIVLIVASDHGREAVGCYSNQVVKTPNLDRLAADTIRSLLVLLEQAGYRTARIGKFHVAPESVYHFQRVLKAGGTNDPAVIGRSPVELAELCRLFMAETYPWTRLFHDDELHSGERCISD